MHSRIVGCRAHMAALLIALDDFQALWKQNGPLFPDWGKGLVLPNRGRAWDCTTKPDSAPASRRPSNAASISQA